MAVYIRRYRKPELTVTLTAGGTLASNTKYYYTGFFKSSRTYNSTVGPFADVSTFTTDSSNKSISVAWKVTVPIQGFDPSGGRTIINATNHCLVAANTLIVEDGSYAGTYTVQSWIDYNKFTINASYNGTYASTFRIETNHNSGSGLEMYMSTTAPFSGDPYGNTWSGNNSNYSHYSWVTGYTTTPFDVSAPYTVNSYINHPQAAASLTQPPQPWMGVMTKGTPYIYVTGTATVAELKQACIDASIIDLAFVTDDTFTMCGIFFCQGTISFTDMNINTYYGMMDSNIISSITYNRCNLSFNHNWYGAYFLATANYCNIFFLPSLYSKVTWGVTGPYSWPIGFNNQIISTEGLSAEGMPIVYTAENMTLNANAQLKLWKFDSSYTTRLIKNCTINKALFGPYYSNSIPESHRAVSGLYIDASTTDRDIVIIYTCNSPMNYRNVDTPRVDNKKLMLTSFVDPSIYRISFWRYNTLKVTDVSGNAIIGATVNIKDSSLNTNNTYTTDASGWTTYEILEELARSSGAGNITTYFDYYNWTVNVSKTGYQNYTNITRIAKDIDNSVTLLKSIEEIGIF